MMTTKMLSSGFSALVAVALGASLVLSTPTPATATAAPPSAHVAAPAPAVIRGGAVPVSGAHSPASPVPGADASANAALAAPPTLAIAQVHCQPSATKASDLSAEFNRRGPVWGGGDGAEPVPIDGGRTLWLFGDTYIGSGSYGGPLTTSGLVHNSMVVQYGGSCFAYLLAGSPGHWGSAIADPNSTDWYWPDSGAYDPQTGVLSIVATHVHALILGDQWAWTLLGVDVMHYRVEPSITLTSVEHLFTYSAGDVVRFGTDETVTGDNVLFYGCAQTGPAQCFVAQTDLGIDASSLEYQTADGWSTDQSDAAPLDIDGLTGLELHVAAVGDGYVATNQIPVLATTTEAWWGPTPTGPFSPIGTVMDSSQPPYGPMPVNWFTYGGRIIDTSAGAIGVFNVNTWDDENAHVAGVYGPRFTAISSSVTDRDPLGNLEAAAAGPDAVSLSGWALDPDTTDPSTVEMIVDGQPVADDHRGDGAAGCRRVSTRRSRRFRDSPRRWRWRAARTRCAPVADNVGLGLTDTTLGCRTVVVGGNPFGNFESATAGPDTVSLSGWALDPDSAAPIDVHVYVDGRWTAMTTASTNRPDVGSAFPGYGAAHGFSTSVAVAGGTHSVCAYAINTASGTVNTRLGCRTVVVGGNPFGHFESATRVGGAVTVGGWALDPDSSAPINVHVYVDGRWTAMTTASTARPDVGASFPAYGPLHGFSLTFGVGAGIHTVCLYAINVGSGTTNPSLGCRLV